MISWQVFWAPWFGRSFEKTLFGLCCGWQKKHSKTLNHKCIHNRNSKRNFNQKRNSNYKCKQDCKSIFLVTDIVKWLIFKLERRNMLPRKYKQHDDIVFVVSDKPKSKKKKI